MTETDEYDTKAITAIRITSEEEPDSDWISTKQNLNSGTKGLPRYLHYTRQKLEAITNIVVITGAVERKTTKSYIFAQQNINEGNDGAPALRIGYTRIPSESIGSNTVIADLAVQVGTQAGQGAGWGKIDANLNLGAKDKQGNPAEAIYLWYKILK